MNTQILMTPIQRKRKALGLTQQQLANMAGLSRQSMNGIERGTVNVTLENLVRLLDILGLSISIADPEAERRAAGRPTRALWMAAKNASVSYVEELTPAMLETALISGELPAGYHAHIAHFLDEAPLQLVIKAVAEAAAKHQRRPEEIWRNIGKLALTTTATRGGLWA